MDQLDDLAINGQPHHYKIDTALFLMAFHANGRTDDHSQRLNAIRSQVGQKPDKATSASLQKKALVLLNDLRGLIEGPNYSAIYSHLSSAANDLT